MKSIEIEIVKAFIEAINGQNLDAINHLMSPDHTFIDGNGGIHDRGKMVDGWPGYYKMFPDYLIHPDEVLSDGPLVAVFGSTSGTYNGKDGMRPENRVGGPAAWKAVIENGKVKVWQVFADYTQTWEVMKREGGNAMDT